mmetsp:Transcript_16997/g.28368  ORF Transcript_16997/g.28368 Transcript_16997/m.28368 type:complete len:149 (-) Transcript_16997:362-808(-)
MPATHTPGNMYPPATKDWDKGLFECCSMKDCGAKCCINELCCCCCTYGDTIAKSGIDPFNLDIKEESSRCMIISLAICCELVPCQSNVIRTMARVEVAKKYGIKDQDMVKGFFLTCCPCTCCCSDFQVMNQVMVEENLRYGCAQMERI